PALFHEALESIAVQLVRPDLEHVSRTACDEDLVRGSSPVSSAEGLSKLRDMHLYGLDGGRRWSYFPQLVDQPVNRDNVVSVEKEHSEERALLDATQANLASIRPDLDRPQDPKLHREAPSLFRRRPASKPLPVLYCGRPSFRRFFADRPHARTNRPHRVVERE